MSGRPGRTQVSCRSVIDQEGDEVKTIWERIEAARTRWNLLEHPFYLRWSAGELSREELAGYAGQYRHATEAIASLSEAAAGAAPPEERGELLRHAEEEADHVALWDGFVGAVGGQVDAKPTPQTQACVRAWTAEDDLLALLMRLYAIESGQPDISRVKREGLAAHYGVRDGEGTAYFRLHEHLDAEHAEAVRKLTERHLDDADEDALVDAAEAAFRANWRLLDGV
jgi:pyrroloquinoline-quinone synthase